MSTLRRTIPFAEFTQVQERLRETKMALTLYFSDPGVIEQCREVYGEEEEDDPVPNDIDEIEASNCPVNEGGCIWVRGVCIHCGDRYREREA